MTDQKKSNPAFGPVIIGLSALILVLAFGLGLYIYQRTLKELTVRSKCPPSVIGVNQGHFRLKIKAAVSKLPKGARVLDFWMPYPQNKANQMITNVAVKSGHPVEVTYDRVYGNAVLHARVANPGGKFDLTMDFAVIRQENMAAKFIDRNVYALKDAGDYRGYLAGYLTDGLLPAARKLGNELTEGTSNNIDKAKAIYDLIASGDKRLAGLKDKLSDLKPGAEPAVMFTALARASGIPVKYISGYAVRNREEGPVGDHASWVEFFAPGYGWIPADPASAKRFRQDTGYYFGNADEWRVELTAGEGLDLEPRQKGRPIGNWIDPYAEVDGRPVKVDKRITWKKEF